MQRKKGLDIRVKQQLRRPAIFCDLINGGLFCGEQRLHPVIFLTFYHGEEPWEGGSSLHDILKFPEGLEDMKQFCPDFRMNLIHA